MILDLYIDQLAVKIIAMILKEKHLFLSINLFKAL